MIALIDYGAGNLTSVKKALSYLGAEITVPTSPAELSGCSGIIVPGVGNFEATAGLADGWTTAVADHVRQGIPLLGICLGLQWLFEGSEEAPNISGLGEIAGTCALLPGDDGTARLKVPHVGWNSLNLKRRSWLLEGISEGSQVYFTHSFAAPVTDECAASTTYGVEFASVVERDQVAGVQFHPEKSGDVGLTILKNYLQRVGSV
jgi:glutamine amidotransferase